LSQQLYGVLAVFEIILRNSIDRHMSVLHGIEWLEDAVAPGGYLDVNEGCEGSYYTVHEAIHKLALEYTHDRLIAKMTLGFWTYQFAAKQFAASGSTLLGIFINRPVGTNQKRIFKSLIKINDIRNRIAHYEPICFDKKAISTDQAERRYELILTLLDWLGFDKEELFYGIDNVRNAINVIECI
jgi:hypothetical protein